MSNINTNSEEFNIPKCNCYEDCNGMWGKYNQDLCHGCCWSVGDKVKYTHFLGTDSVHRSGNLITEAGFCPNTAACGEVTTHLGNITVEVEYVCIGARGNFHSQSNEPRLPKQISSPWDIPPVIALPFCEEDPTTGLPLNPNEPCCQDSPTDPNAICDKVEYVSNLSHLNGCYQDWTYTYAKNVVGFKVRNDGGGNYWDPIYADDVNDTDYTKSQSIPRSCCCGESLTSSCNGLYCIMDTCPNPREPEFSSLCGEKCVPLKWNGDENNPMLMMNRNENCTNDCYNEGILWNDPCDVNPTPWSYPPFSDNPLFDCPPCRRTGKQYQTAIIFALNLDNRPDIKYCQDQGYWIQGVMPGDPGGRYWKYPISPYLVLLCKPIWEWDCPCVDTDGEPYLKDEVWPGPGISPEELKYKKSIMGGYSWYRWTGNCDCDTCLGCALNSPTSCVFGCNRISNPNLLSGRVPQFTSIINGAEFGPDWVPLGTVGGSPPGTIPPYAMSLAPCSNCSESISSCAGFKSYCVRRIFERPEGGCPGECQGFYGPVWDPETRCTEDCGSIGGGGEAKCGYGIPTQAAGGGLSDIYPCCATQKCGSFVWFGAAMNRDICVGMTIQTLTIEPVENDERRCKWQEWREDEKQKRCCGRSNQNIENSEDIGIVPKNEPPFSIDANSPNGYIFSWTEAENMDDGGIGWPNKSQATALCQENTNICPPGDLKCYNGSKDELCDCSQQAACGGLESSYSPFEFLNPEVNISRPCVLSACHTPACAAGAPRCPYNADTNPIWNVQPPDFIDKNNWELCFDSDTNIWGYCEDGEIVSWLLCEGEDGWDYCPKEIYDSYEIAGGIINLGCSCWPPDCGCYNSTGDPIPGNYQLPNDIGRCFENNYANYKENLCFEPGVERCVTDPVGCPYQGCEIGDVRGSSFSLIECPCGGTLCENGGCSQNYSCFPKEGAPTDTVCSGGGVNLCEPPDSNPDCECVIDDESCPEKVYYGRVVYNGRPISNVEITNSATKDTTYTNENGYYVLNIELSREMYKDKLIDEIDIFYFKYENNIGFVGSVVVLKQDPTNFEKSISINKLNLETIILEEIESTDLPENYCVLCSYICSTENNCETEEFSCIVPLIDTKNLSLNCSEEKIIQCFDENTDSYCSYMLNKVELTLCENSDNPNYC